MDVRADGWRGREDATCYNRPLWNSRQPLLCAGCTMQLSSPSILNKNWLVVFSSQVFFFGLFFVFHYTININVVKLEPEHNTGTLKKMFHPKCSAVKLMSNC